MTRAFEQISRLDVLSAAASANDHAFLAPEAIMSQSTTFDGDFLHNLTDVSESTRDLLPISSSPPASTGSLNYSPGSTPNSDGNNDVSSRLGS